VAAAFNLHTAEEVRERMAHAQQQVAEYHERALAAAQAELEQVKADLARATESRVSEAVERVACPVEACKAQPGERCHTPKGLARRTHPERIAAWHDIEATARKTTETAHVPGNTAASRIHIPGCTCPDDGRLACTCGASTTPAPDRDADADVGEAAVAQAFEPGSDVPQT
jgi:hypothetical protein